MNTMKEREVIKYMTSDIQAKMPDIEQVRANCLNQSNRPADEIPTQKVKSQRMPIKRLALIMAAVIFSFTMIVSVTAVIMQQYQYIPFRGFVKGGEYEVYYMPEILKLGQHATVETAMRVNNGKASELSVIITDTLYQNIKIITEKHGEFNLIPVIDYRYSSFGTMNKFSFDNEGGYTSYGYYIENFPDINEFTLVNGNEAVKVKLLQSDNESVLTAEDSGISVRFYSMSKGSKVLAYEIYEDNFDFEKIFGYSSIEINGQTYKMFYNKNMELGPGSEEFKLYDENGYKILLNGYDTNKGPDGLSTVMFLRTQQGKKISKMEVGCIGGSINPAITAIEDIPVPADGEEIFFNDGLLLYDSNGLISKLTYIKRQGNHILIYTDTEYIGEDIENIDFYINWNGILGPSMGGWTGNTWFEINGDEKFVKLYSNAVHYIINGSWEIKFD